MATTTAYREEDRPHEIRTRRRCMPQAGFSLIEMMSVIGIAAILASVGAPSLKYMLEVNQLAAQTNRIVSALHFARSEAVKRNARVTLCKSDDGAVCDNSAGWQDGWIVFVDDGVGGGNSGNGVRDGSEVLINTNGVSDGRFTFPGSADFVSFAGDGTSRTAANTLIDPVLIVQLNDTNIDQPNRCLRVRDGGGLTNNKGTGC